MTNHDFFTYGDIPAFIGWVFSCIRHSHLEDPATIEAEDPILAPWCAELGMHFGTFQLTDEAIDDPLHALAAARSAQGVADGAFTTLDFGETLDCFGVKVTLFPAGHILGSAQVLVESMTNNLRVNGQSATAALDNTINRLAGSVLPSPTASLPITAGMIDAARIHPGPRPGPERGLAQSRMPVHRHALRVGILRHQGA